MTTKDTNESANGNTCTDCGSSEHVAHSAREWSEICALSGVTKADLRALRMEALAAGDQIQADLCDVAISGEDSDGTGTTLGTPVPHACAYAACIDAINSARAMDDSEVCS